MMKLNKVKDKLLSQKKIYKVILIVILVGIIIGLIYPFFLDSNSKELLKSSVSSFFLKIKTNNIDKFLSLKNSLISNGLLIFIIFILGISIIGVPIIILILLYKGFILGFSFSSIISIYKFKGILASILYLIPVPIILMVTYILVGFYGIKLSSNLFKNLILKKNINLNIQVTRYFKIFCIALISLILCSLFDSYVSVYIIKLFTFLI